MRTILVDDDEINLDAFTMEAEDIKEIKIIGKFMDPQKALEFAAENAVDLAVLDVEMPQMNGLELGRRLREIRPNVVLIYVTGYKDYAFDAYQLYASAYILKPFSRTDILEAIFRARRLLGKNGEKNVFIRTFGRFEVFVDDKPVAFNSSKAKELLALLVDRNGGIVTTEEILTYLWEDKVNSDSSRSLCRKVIQRLRNNLENAGIEEIMLHHKHGKSIAKDKVRCDYYLYLDGEAEGIDAFNGEYMSNYSWGETTLGGLIEIGRRRQIGSKV